MIIALQRAASTPSEMTKQNLYKSTEDLFRIYLEFMAEYYGTRYVDVSPRPDMIQAAAFAMMPAPESVLAPFDFKTLKYHPMTLKLDVGASTYYSEIASMQTLDRLLELNVITPVQYLERISDDYVPQRRALIAEKKQEQMPMAQLPPVQKDGEVEGGDILPLGKMDIPTGRGFGELQRKINNTGDTAGLI